MRDSEEEAIANEQKKLLAKLRAIAREKFAVPKRVPGAHSIEMPEGHGGPGWNKGRKYPPHILSREEIMAMIQKCPTWTHDGRKMRAAISLLWRCGVRISEMLHLLRTDLDLQMGTLRIRSGKGRKYRVLGMDSQTIHSVAKHLELEIPSAWLFPSRIYKGKRPLTYQQINDSLRFLGAKAGVVRRVNPHCFRHTFATEMLREGVSIGVISKALGHASIATTAVYLDHICPEEVMKEMRRRHWDD